MKLINFWPMVILLTLAACSSPDPTNPSDRAADKSLPEIGGEPIGHYIHANQEAMGRQTFQNAYKLERAVWRFAADNDGVVPSYLGDDNLAGKYLVDYLPGKRKLKNAFTGARNQPIDEPAIIQGEVGYLSIHDNLGYVIGFRITAMGMDTDQYLVLDRFMEGREPPETWESGSPPRDP